MWVAGRILGNHFLLPSWLAAVAHPRKIPFCGSLGWEGHSSTAPETGTFHSFLVGCQPPGLAGPRELVSALWSSLSRPNTVSSLPVNSLVTGTGNRARTLFT